MPAELRHTLARRDSSVMHVEDYRVKTRRKLGCGISSTQMTRRIVLAPILNIFNYNLINFELNTNHLFRISNANLDLCLVKRKPECYPVI